MHGEITEQLLDTIFKQHSAQLKNTCIEQEPLVICFSGTPGMGKSTVAKKLEPIFQAVRVCTDDVRVLLESAGITAQREEALEKYLSYFFVRYTLPNKRFILDASIDRRFVRLFPFFEKRKINYIVIRLEVPRSIIVKRIQERDGDKADRYLEKLDSWFDDYRHFATAYYNYIPYINLDNAYFDSLIQSIDQEIIQLQHQNTWWYQTIARIKNTGASIRQLFARFFTSTAIHPVDIAITIDDYPLANGALFTVAQRTEEFVTTCDQYNCKAVFFCVGQHCKDRGNDALFALLNNHGHFIANHSMNHVGLSKITIDTFEREILLTERILKPYAQMRKWFRYPYLDYALHGSGDDKQEKCMSSIASLHKLGYTEGYVTINTMDYYVNKRMQEAIKKQKQIDYVQLRLFYLALLEEWIEYYINHYRHILNRDITHTLLLHDNDLNALYLPDILAMIKRKGWRIVSPEQAFQDVSWRRELLNAIDLVKKRPSSFNNCEIDKQLAALQIIW